MLGLQRSLIPSIMWSSELGGSTAGKGTLQRHVLLEPTEQWVGEQGLRRE